MHKMFRAKPLERSAGGDTFARIVFTGPVLMNRPKIAPNRHTHAAGNGNHITPSTKGSAANADQPDTRKYDPGKRARNRSPSQPPARVADRPPPARMVPK